MNGNLGSIKWSVTVIPDRGDFAQGGVLNRGASFVE